MKANGEPKKALAAYNEALSLKPNYAEALNSKGNIFLKLGKLTAAIAAYNKALALKPNYAEANENLFSLEIQLLGSKLFTKPIASSLNDKETTCILKETPTFPNFKGDK